VSETHTPSRTRKVGTTCCQLETTSQRHPNMLDVTPSSLLFSLFRIVHSFHCSQGESSNNCIFFLVGMMWALAMGHHRRLGDTSPRLHASLGRRTRNRRNRRGAMATVSLLLLTAPILWTSRPKLMVGSGKS
jgi:hypothetical protein